MICTSTDGPTGLPCLRSLATAAIVAVSVMILPHATGAAKAHLAGTLHVEAQHYSWGDLISLKGAVEGGDPFRAARIMVEAGQRPDPSVRRPALSGTAAARLDH